MNEDVKSENLRIHSRADELIACLEGEIAKRDETIARLEPQLNRAIQANYDLREELAACRVAVENCDLFRARIAELEDDLKCAHSMLSEVSKAGMALRAELAATKAQGVVMPEPMKRAEKNDAIAYKAAIERQGELRTERDQHAQQIGELEGLLREWRRMFDGGLESGQLGVLRGQTDAALSAGKEGE